MIYPCIQQESYMHSKVANCVMSRREKSNKFNFA